MRERFSPTANAKQLPPELVKELNLANDVEDDVLKIFSEGGGTLNVSEVLVGYFQMFNKVETRRHMTSILYRMKQKKLLVPTGKKGEYTTS